MHHREELLNCSLCGKSQTITIFPYIDIETQPNLKQQVYYEALLTPKCIACHEPLQIIYPCVYHDEKEKLFIYVAPFYQPGDEKTLKYDLFDDINKSEGYHLRVVTNFCELLESLYLFYYHLDDRIYQIVKVMIGAELQSQIIPHQLINSFIDSDDWHQLYFSFLDDQQQQYKIPINHEIVALVEAAYQHKWQKSHDFELIDFVWAQQMIEEFE